MKAFRGRTVGAVGAALAIAFGWLGCSSDDSGIAPPTVGVYPEAGAVDGDYPDFGPHQVTPLSSVPAALLGAYTITVPANVPAVYASTGRLDVHSDAAFLNGAFGNMGFDAFRIESGAFWFTTSHGGDMIRIPLAEDGHFGGVVDVDANGGGGYGSIAPDHDAPLVVVASQAAGYGLNGSFPWSPVVVSVSEAVDPGEIPGSITTDLPTLTVDPIAADPAFDFGRVMTATLHESSWASLGGTTAQVSVAPLYDPSGNASAVVGGSVTFVTVPTGPSFDFANGAASVLAWDPGATPTLVFRGPSDAVCESGSCVALGPYSDDILCGMRGDIGFAASLVAPAPITRILVRYRFLVSTPDGSPIDDLPKEAHVDAFSTKAAAGADLGFVTKELSPTTELGLTSTTTWRTAIATLAVPATEVGVVLHAGLACRPIPGRDPVRGLDPIANDVDESILLVGGITAE